MPIDRTIIGEAAATFLDRLDDKYGERGSLTAVMLIVAVDTGASDTVEFAGYDGNGAGLAGWKAKGLLSFVDENIGSRTDP